MRYRLDKMTDLIIALVGEEEMLEVTPEEIEAHLENLKPRYHAAIVLYYGLETGECLSYVKVGRLLKNLNHPEKEGVTGGRTAQVVAKGLRHIRSQIHRDRMEAPTTTPEGLPEKTENWDVSTYLARWFRQHHLETADQVKQYLVNGLAYSRGWWRTGAVQELTKVAITKRNRIELCQYLEKFGVLPPPPKTPRAKCPYCGK